MQTQQPKKPYFYLRGLSGEKLTTPIHIHFDSFKSITQSLPIGIRPPNGAQSPYGSFLVTLLGPMFRPIGQTCRVSGVNFAMSRDGVKESILARVAMVIDADEESPIEPAQIFLREDGSVFGIDSKGNRDIDLTEVYFSYGDTVHLDGDGNPFDEDRCPRPTARQRAFMERQLREDRERILSQSKGAGAA